MHRSLKFLLWKTNFPGRAKAREAAQDSGLCGEFGKQHWLMIASSRPFHGLWGRAFVFWALPCVAAGVIFSLGFPGSSSNLPSRGIPRGVSIPSPTLLATHQWRSVSALTLSSAGNQNTMCANIKSCRLFTLRTSGRRKRKSQLSFHLKKKKLAQCSSTGGLKAACY